MPNGQGEGRKHAYAAWENENSYAGHRQMEELKSILRPYDRGTPTSWPGDAE